MNEFQQGNLFCPPKLHPNPFSPHLPTQRDYYHECCAVSQDLTHRSWFCNNWRYPYENIGQAFDIFGSMTQKCRKVLWKLADLTN